MRLDSKQSDGSFYTVMSVGKNSKFPVLKGGFITNSFNIDNAQGIVFNATGRSGFGSGKGALNNDFLAYTDNNNTFRIGRQVSGVTRSVFAANSATTNLYAPNQSAEILVTDASTILRSGGQEMVKLTASDRRVTFTVKNGSSTKTRTLGSSGTGELATLGDLAPYAKIVVANNEAAAKTGSAASGQANTFGFGTRTNLWVLQKAVT